MQRALKSYGLVLLAGCLWGTNGLFVKLMQGSGSSSTYTGFLRIALSLVIISVITLIKEGPKAFKVTKNTLLSCVMLGLICQAAYNFLYSEAINSLGMSFACILTYMAPVFTSMFSYLIFKEKFGPNKYVAIVMNLAGGALTVTGGSLHGISFATSGLIFGITASVCYSLVGIFGRLASGGTSPFVIATYNFLFGTIFYALFTHPWTTVADPLKPSILLYGFLYALIPTGLNYVIYFTGVGRIKESSKVPVLASVENVVSVVIGILVFHEKMGMMNLLGVVMVLASIAVMNVELPIFKKKTEDVRVDVRGQVTVS